MTIDLRTSHDMLSFEATTGTLVSFRSQAAPEQEFIAARPDQPAFVLQYLDDEGAFRQIASGEAKAITVDHVESRLTARYHGLAGLALDVVFTVRCAADDRFSRWNISVDNRAGLRLVDVQFPFVITAADLGGTPGSRAIARPYSCGELYVEPGPETLKQDAPGNWQLGPDNGDSSHYPGGTFAQFIAYYNDRAGLYLACEDTAANVKLIKAAWHDPGIRLGIAHIGDWPAQGARTLEYDIVLGSFTGDWYDATDLYRAWSEQQSWFVPLHRRTDHPAWLLDSPPYITIRPQGLLDDGPVFPIEEFLPYEKCIPLLEKVAERVESPLVALIMGWERGGSWVYPDCFPPIGGDESVTNFARMARERGWHLGSFCNGTRWVMGHLFNGYDGAAYFREHDGERTVCRTAGGKLWEEVWDQTWRPSYACCLGEPHTRDIATDFVRRIIGWGLESIQFFDQNLGAATFPCFSAEHEHPPIPGKWMAEKMRQIIDAFHAVAAEAGETEVIHSTEQPANETCLPIYQECDVRVFPPGYGDGFVIPLYNYLYHECIVMQGGMGGGPEPYHLPIRNAYNGVLGIIPGAVMTGDGTLLNKDTFNWAIWEPKVGNDDHALEMIRTVTALRRGPGKPYLVFGRMQHPATVSCETITWDRQDHTYHVPAVFHAAWQSPEEHFAVVLANWTDTEQEVTITDGRLGEQVRGTIAGRTLTEEQMVVNEGNKVTMTLPALSCVMVERM